MLKGPDAEDNGPILKILGVAGIWGKWFEIAMEIEMDYIFF